MMTLAAVNPGTPAQSACAVPGLSVCLQATYVLQSWSSTPSPLDACASHIRHWMKNKVLFGKEQELLKN